MAQILMKKREGLGSWVSSRDGDGGRGSGVARADMSITQGAPGKCRFPGLTLLPSFPHDGPECVLSTLAFLISSLGNSNGQPGLRIRRWK